MRFIYFVPEIGMLKFILFSCCATHVRMQRKFHFAVWQASQKNESTSLIALRELEVFAGESKRKWRWKYLVEVCLCMCVHGNSDEAWRALIKSLGMDGDDGVLWGSYALPGMENVISVQIHFLRTPQARPPPSCPFLQKHYCASA